MHLVVRGLSKWPGFSTASSVLTARLVAAGILASKLGADVVLTDLDQPAILDNLTRNCAANGAACRVLGLAWGDLPPAAAALRHERPHLLLAADCLYDAAKFDALLSTAAFLLAGRPPGEAALIAVFQVHEIARFSSP